VADADALVVSGDDARGGTTYDDLVTGVGAHAGVRGLGGGR
jgi:hypothetical protein